MATNPKLLSTPLAENGTRNEIPETQAAVGDGLFSETAGFPDECSLPPEAGGKFVQRADMNGAFHLLSKLMFYAQKGWTFQYDESQDYFKGCVVIDPADGNRYECIADMAAGTVAPSADTDNEYWKRFSLGDGIPLGAILPYSANAAAPPPGFLYAEGQAVSRTMYPDYFALVGTTYGEGDGETTFNLPNMLGRFLEGADTAGTAKEAGLPNIEGKFGYAVSHYQNEGCFVDDPTRRGELGGNGVEISIRSLDASRSNPIYGNSDTVQPPSMTVRYIVKVYDAPTPSSAEIDLSQYASDLANRLTREQTPAFNKRDVITASGTYTLPVTGWYKITVKGGGGGGGKGKYISAAAFSAGGGGEGGTTIGYEHLDAGDTMPVVVGAGGAGATTTNTAGGDGGDTSVVVNGTTYTGGGGHGGLGAADSDITNNQGKGGSGTIAGCSGSAGKVAYQTRCSGGVGGGNGGGLESPVGSINAAVDGGGGGGGGAWYNQEAGNGGAGGDGYVWMEYFDPSLN